MSEGEGVRLYGLTPRGLAPRDGFEPSTQRLTAACSTTELPGIGAHPTTRKIRRDGVPWRPEAESNRCTRICSPLHSHSAIRPSIGTPWHTRDIGARHEKGQAAPGRRFRNCRVCGDRAVAALNSDPYIHCLSKPVKDPRMARVTVEDCVGKVPNRF